MGTKRGYADTPDGQVHYRVNGPKAGPPLVMLHFAPGCGRQYEAVLPVLGAKGYRAHAPDLMGYGDSDKPAAQWPVERFAENLGHVLDELGLDSAFLVGGHSSAAVVAEFAVRNPARARAIVLDGCPVYSLEERTARFGAYARPMALDPDGDMLKWAWKRSFRRPDMPLDRVFAATLDLLKAGATWHTGYDAVFSYDMAARLPLLAVRTLVMTAEEDPLHRAYTQTLAMIPGGRGHAFPGRAPLADPARAEEWAAPVDAFLRGA